MNLQQLKQSLARLGSDFNDNHLIMIVLGPDGKKQHHLLAGVGVLEKFDSIALISQEVCQKMINDGTLRIKEDDSDDADYWKNL